MTPATIPDDQLAAIIGNQASVAVARELLALRDRQWLQALDELKADGYAVHVSWPHGAAPALFLDGARAMDYASRHHGSVVDLVARP